MLTEPAQDMTLLSPVFDKLETGFSAGKAAKLQLFTRLYYASSSRSELDKSTEQELYDSVIDAWDFLQLRKSSVPKVHFVHRKLDKDRTRQTGTSIYVLVNDMPFVVDSLRQSLNRNRAVIRNVHNAVYQVSRHPRGSEHAGKLRNINETKAKQFKAEALCCINCAHLSEEHCREIEKDIKDTLKHVASAVRDFGAMVGKAAAIQESLQARADSLPVSREEVDESVAFMDWLRRNHFTFLGYEEYRIKKAGQGRVIELQRDSLLGISRLKSALKTRATLSSLPKDTGDLILKKQICSFAKSAIRSKVHRPAYYDYVLVREFDEKGNVAIEHRFVGLYTSAVYYRAALDIPLVRNKVNAVLAESGFAPNGHSIKDLLQVINVFPRDELFQISQEALFNTALEISRIQETRTNKLFVRKDTYGKFFSCLVFVPRENYNSKLRKIIQKFLKDKLQAQTVEFDTYFSESLLARLHLILHVPAIHEVAVDVVELEQQLIELIKPWDDYFLEELLALHHDSAAEQIHGLYAGCYSSAYKDAYTPQEAVRDITRIQKVVETRELQVDLDVCDSEIGAELSFKIFSHANQLYISDVAPILENLGLKIISEKAFSLQPEGEHAIWLHDFSLRRQQASRVAFSENLKLNFEQAFNAIWLQRTDDDLFNQLVVTAQMDWRDAALLRAYSAYLKQIQFSYSTQFIAETLSRHSKIATMLIRYFYGLFDPAMQDEGPKSAQRIRHALLKQIDNVVHLPEDNVLRALVGLFDATLRTNFFQPSYRGLKDYFSFKLSPALIEGVPLPVPQFEIFVFSSTMEGVHLRGGKIARGGLRWSDRHEDYRTEVLGLVKAQQVKNSVIVPVGAKGGFVVKSASSDQDRETARRMGIACYKTFICGLLDITDNIVDDQVVAPQAVVRRDEDDPYLVVAADKGTATFSDTANEIAQSYKFWLGDGFASGGSNGYDHKAMGITARGAWVSVQRHFRELGINVQEQDFTVVGIGDMSGDVFGNGMLLSTHICLVAAFNHQHIFIDPNPKAEASFRERSRLFETPGSSWSDYDASLLSAGGGVFERSAKSIKVSAEMKQRFALDVDAITPDKLIVALLRSEVDLIWNGGIGTYVKASFENHNEVGDKANDSVRVDARELRCRVIGEGGNLGLTQAARVEFGLNGGVSLTDFVDNSAGVDCSDHEVNIKILLNKLEEQQRISGNLRNKLLESMTDTVADLVLANNYAQAQAIGIAHAQMSRRHREFGELISFLENNAGLDRYLEHLPSDDQLEERSAREEFLTRPELAVLTSYMKMYLKSELAPVAFVDDEYLLSYLYSAFPGELLRDHKSDLAVHPLRREIIATQLANSVVNLLGPNFVYRMLDSTATTVSEVIKATIIAKEIYQIEPTWAAIEALDYVIPEAIQTEMMWRVTRLLAVTTRWLLRNRRGNLDFARDVEYFSKGIDKVRQLIVNKLPPQFASIMQDRYEYFVAQGVPEELAMEVCRGEFLASATSFVEINARCNEELDKIMDIFYSIGERLQLNWLAHSINELPVGNYWQALARESYLDDLSWQQRALTANIVSTSAGSLGATDAVEAWIESHDQAVARVAGILANLQTETRPDYSMFSVALRELLNLAQSTAHGA